MTPSDQRAASCHIQRRRHTSDCVTHFSTATARTNCVARTAALAAGKVEAVRRGRPLAGTRRRGRTQQEDAHLAADLLADGKECAEHVMLLDLGRNDVGRVSTAGSVQVTTPLLPSLLRVRGADAHDHLAARCMPQAHFGPSAHETVAHRRCWSGVIGMLRNK